MNPSTGLGLHLAHWEHLEGESRWSPSAEWEAHGVPGFDRGPWGGMWALRLPHGRGPLLALVTQGSRGGLGPWRERRSETWAPRVRGRSGLGAVRRLSCSRGSQGCTGSEIKPQHMAAATPSIGPRPQAELGRLKAGNRRLNDWPTPPARWPGWGVVCDSSCAPGITRRMMSP